MLDETPTTVLQAVNLMLATIGESPINTVEDNGVVDAVVARQILSNINREVQSRGWHWNEERGYRLAPSYPDGEVTLPANTMRVDAVEGDADLDVVQRGSRLYDRRSHSYKFDKAVTVDLVVLLPFDELPEAARNYIAIRSARRFQENFVGSSELSQFSLRDELLAKVTLEDAEAETAGYNILNNPSVAQVMRR